VPEEVRSENIDGARCCYIPYNLYVADTPEVLVNHAYLLKCWRIFCINRDTQDYFRKHSLAASDNTVVTGHPKIDYIRSYRSHEGDWPIASSGKRRLRVLWAPHHSVTGDWLGFGTFLDVYKEILMWARTDKDVEIVMRPHHITFARLVATNSLTQEQLDSFLAEWNALDNTAMDPHVDCSPAFAACDVMLTDGVSFIVEFQVLDKPLVYLESRIPRAPFTPFGARFAECAYRVQSIRGAIKFLRDYRVNRADPHGEDRRLAIQERIQTDGLSVNRILHHLAEGGTEHPS
jgi:hypothetical protein